MKFKKHVVLSVVLAAALAFFLVSVPTTHAKSKSGLNVKGLSSQGNKLTKQAGQAANALKSKININKVDLDTLTQLKGIGPEKAKAILDYRKKFGSFKQIEDLMKVKGIGEKTFNMIKPFITVK